MLYIFYRIRNNIFPQSKWKVLFKLNDQTTKDNRINFAQCISNIIWKLMQVQRNNLNLKMFPNTPFPKYIHKVIEIKIIMNAETF